MICIKLYRFRLWHPLWGFCSIRGDLRLYYENSITRCFHGKSDLRKFNFLSTSGDRNISRWIWKKRCDLAEKSHAKVFKTCNFIEINFRFKFWTGISDFLIKVALETFRNLGTCHRRNEISEEGCDNLAKERSA